MAVHSAYRLCTKSFPIDLAIILSLIHLHILLSYSICSILSTFSSYTLPLSILSFQDSLATLHYRRRKSPQHSQTVIPSPTHIQFPTALAALAALALVTSTGLPQPFATASPLSSAAISAHQPAQPAQTCEAGQLINTPNGPGCCPFNCPDCLNGEFKLYVFAPRTVLTLDIVRRQRIADVRLSLKKP